MVFKITPTLMLKFTIHLRSQKPSQNTQAAMAPRPYRLKTKYYNSFVNSLRSAFTGWFFSQVTQAAKFYLKLYQLYLLYLYFFFI